MMFIIALVVAIIMIALVSIGVIVMTPVFRISMATMNSTMYREGSGAAITHFNFFQNIYLNLWGIVAMIVGMAFILYVYLYAQRKEVVTGVGYY